MSIFKNLFGASQDKQPSIWNSVLEEKDLDELVSKSNEQPVLLLKHSTRCSISSMAKNRLERDWSQLESKVQPYIINVVEQRPLSNAVESKFNIRHESPQVIVIDKGIVVYDGSHGEILGATILKAIAQ